MYASSPYTGTAVSLLQFMSLFHSSVFPLLTELLAAPSSAAELEVEEGAPLGWKPNEAELTQ